jgi:hypothetical protein
MDLMFVQFSDSDFYYYHLLMLVLFFCSELIALTQEQYFYFLEISFGSELNYIYFLFALIILLVPEA